MTLRFKDEKGRCGKVTDSLEVEYSGPWQEDVVDVVEEAKGEVPDDAHYGQEDPLSYLIIELPENAPIIEVGRDESNL